MIGVIGWAFDETDPNGRVRQGIGFEEVRSDGAVIERSGCYAIREQVGFIESSGSDASSDRSRVVGSILNGGDGSLPALPRPPRKFRGVLPCGYQRGQERGNVSGGPEVRPELPARESPVGVNVDEARQPGTGRGLALDSPSDGGHGGLH